MFNEELHNLNPLVNIFSVIKPRRIGMTGLMVGIKDMRYAHKISAEKPYRKRPIGKTRRVCRFI